MGRGEWLVLSEREGLERLTEVLETSDHDPFDAAEAVDWKRLARDEHAQHESALPAAPKQGVEHDSSVNELRQLEANGHPRVGPDGVGCDAEAAVDAPSMGLGITRSEQDGDNEDWHTEDGFE